MEKIIVCSVFSAFEYVMDHYYPYGCEELAQRKDRYAIISIQDSHTKGFGFQFVPNKYCQDVLTLIFDDVIRPVDGAVTFTDDMAEQIFEFVERNQSVDTLLIHCYAGQSRSMAVAKFLAEVNKVPLNMENPTLTCNDLVYESMELVWDDFVTREE